MIYFIQCGGAGPIKIGYSENPTKRLYHLQIAHFEPLRLLGVMDGSLGDEHGLHERFSSIRRIGEWFQPDQALLDFISAHSSPVVARGRELADHPFWKGDAAADTTKRARVQRRFEVGACQHCGRPGKNRILKDGDYSNLSADNVLILCQRCTMIRDGRMERMDAIRPVVIPMPPKPCTNCSRPKKPLRKGLCGACNEYQRRTGRPRPTEKDK